MAKTECAERKKQEITSLVETLVIDEKKVKEFLDMILEEVIEFEAYKDDRAYNKNVVLIVAPAAAKVQFSLAREELKLVQKYKEPELSPDFNKRVAIIEGLEEEYKALKCEMKRCAEISLSDVEWRCIFRSLRDNTMIETLKEFISVHEDWTNMSVDYLILLARREHDAAEFCSLIASAKGTDKEKAYIEAQMKLDQEYGDRIDKLKQRLLDCINDLENFSHKLIFDYSIIQEVEELF